MKNAMVWIVVIGLVVVFSGVVSAQQKAPDEVIAQKLVDTVVKGCDKEINMYCKDVTPGEGRGLACLYAHEDKLSAQCEYALYDAAAQLERAINTMSYAVNECREDLSKFCSDLKPGQGRLLKCLEKNDANVSKRCKQALKDTKMRK
jgi:Cysteine rich repeat